MYFIVGSLPERAVARSASCCRQRATDCPQGDGAFNDEGIAFYDRFINDLIARGIEPMVCLYHFDMPLALAQEYNGFNDRRVMDAFIRYGKKMIDCFGDRVKYWLTFNEQNIFHMPEAFRISGYVHGEKTLRELYELLSKYSSLV